MHQNWCMILAIITYFYYFGNGFFPLILAWYWTTTTTLACIIWYNTPNFVFESIFGDIVVVRHFNCPL